MTLRPISWTNRKQYGRRIWTRMLIFFVHPLVQAYRGLRRRSESSRRRHLRCGRPVQCDFPGRTTDSETSQGAENQCRQRFRSYPDQSRPNGVRHGSSRVRRRRADDPNTFIRKRKRIKSAPQREFIFQLTRWPLLVSALPTERLVRLTAPSSSLRWSSSLSSVYMSPFDRSSTPWSGSSLVSARYPSMRRLISAHAALRAGKEGCVEAEAPRSQNIPRMEGGRIDDGRLPWVQRLEKGTVRPHSPRRRGLTPRPGTRRPVLRLPSGQEGASILPS